MLFFSSTACVAVFISCLLLCSHLIIQMLKVGMPLPAIKMKMELEGLDPEMIDKAPDTLVPAKDEEDETVKACEHPRYAKFFKMLKVGMPLMAVRAKVELEGLDGSVVEKDPNELIPLKEKKEGTVAAMDHPIYGQYFKVRSNSFLDSIISILCLQSL